MEIENILDLPSAADIYRPKDLIPLAASGIVSAIATVFSLIAGFIGMDGKFNLFTVAFPLFSFYYIFITFRLYKFYQFGTNYQNYRVRITGWINVAALCLGIVGGIMLYVATILFIELSSNEVNSKSYIYMVYPFLLAIFSMCTFYYLIRSYMLIRKQ